MRQGVVKGTSGPDLERLRLFSPAAARILDARPAYARFLERAPELRAVLRARPGSERRTIRLLRARVLLHTAYAELSGASPLLTGRLWADAADVSIALAERLAAREVGAKLGPSPVGRAVFALGKLGSRELNPSSDVDLLCLYERDGALPGSAQTIHEWHVQWARRLRSILSDVDDDGFAFRVDFDLRPEGTAGALANSIDALESYYERFGQTWERAALLRLRAVVDVGGIAPEVVKRLRPFVFPKSVHDSAVDELFAMKGRVTASARAEGFDVKRGRGGIREVEFVVQAHQLLHGGRHPELRSGSTVELLQKLEQRGHLPHRTVVELIEGYTFLRRVEHALQYAEDRQTQLLPAFGPERARVASAIAARDFDERLDRHRENIHRAFERLLGESRDLPSEDARRALDRTQSDDERIRALTRLGFSDAARALALIRILERRRGSPFSPLEASHAAARDAGGHVLDHIARSPDPLSALARLPDLFLERVPRASLLRIADDRRTLALAARLLAVSAPLSRLLAKHHGLDEVLARGVSSARFSARAVGADLGGADEEMRLLQMRAAHSRRTLSIALAFFAGKIDVFGAELRLSTLADALLREASSIAREKIRRRHGDLPRLRFCVVALGSLGGRELGFFRDLDLLFVYESPDLESEGPKRIPAAEYAARTAQQIIWALSAPLAEGSCYSVDSRLRPSGSQGALTTSLRAFIEYHARSSAVWERQALLRARVVDGDRDLGRRLIAAAKSAAFSSLPPGLGMRLLDMRARMIAERAAKFGIDLKMGEGGLADIEFAVQGLQLQKKLWSPSTRRAVRKLAPALEHELKTLAHAREALALVDDKREPAVTPTDPRLDLLQRAGVLEGGYENIARAAANVREMTSRIFLRLH